MGPGVGAGLKHRREHNFGARSSGAWDDSQLWDHSLRPCTR